MENIHILPTDKPSRFWVTNLGNLARCQDVEPIKKALGNNVNIYIISDEEIKEVDWVIECSLNWVFKMHKHGLPNYNPNKKKIILTTDQDLIKDGVQAIDDEFLEWFVKNPSCERVKVNKEWNEEIIIDGKDIGDYSYKIIIPQEEFTIIKGGDDIVFPSSTTITVFKPLPDVNWESDIINEVWDEEAKQLLKENQLLILALKLPNEDLKVLSDSIVSRLPQEEIKQIKCYCGHTITCDCEPLQETLEEAAENHHNTFTKDLSYAKTRRESFIEGAKWQQKRMYSKEKFKQAVKDAYDNGINAGYNSPINGEQYYKEYEQRRIN